MEILSRKQLETTMDVLTEDQRNFLEHKLKIRKKSQWLQILAQYKGVHITNEMSTEEIEERIDDWILIDYLDGGYKKRPYKCDCGQSLRFQYIIQNKKEGEVRKLGVHCFEKYLSLPASVIKDVKSGMYDINLERDEILTKLHKNLFFPLSRYLHLHLPSDIIEQYEIGLPLTDVQIHFVERINERYQEEKRLSHLFHRLDGPQKAYVSKMNHTERRELLLSLENGYIEELVPDEDLSDLDEEIQKHIHLHLPLLQKHQEQIADFKSKRKRNRLLNQLSEGQRNWILGFNAAEQNEILESLNQTSNYSINKLKGLPISDEIIKQVQLNLPLLNRQQAEIMIAKQKVNEAVNSDATITFGMLMDRHLQTLRAVREKENVIPPGLKKDWKKIQELSRQLQNGQEFDYGLFKLLLSNLTTPLKVERDVYL